MKRPPLCRVYIQVWALSEGEAAIKAHKYLSEHFSIGGMDSLVYQEAQAKPK